jgi:hypothetical protein
LSIEFVFTPLERPLPPHSLYSVKIHNVVGYDPEGEDRENKRRRDTVKEVLTSSSLKF